MDLWYAHLSRGRPAGRDREVAAQGLRKARTASGQGSKGEARRRSAGPTQTGRPKVAGAAPSRPTRRCARRTPGTACRRCPSSAELVDGRYRIVSQPPVVVPARELAADLRPGGRRAGERRSTTSSGSTGHPAARPPAPAGTVRDRRHGPQGRRRRQRRHPGVHRAAAGPRRARPAVPAGEGGDPVGAGGPPAQEPVPQPGRAGGAGAAADAGRQRHLPGLDQGRAGRPLLLLAAAAGHEGLRAGGHHGGRRPGVLRAGCAGGPSPGPTPAPATRSRSPHTSATTTRSTGRSPTSPSATPTRTNWTTRHSPTPSTPHASRPTRGSVSRPGDATAARSPSAAGMFGRPPPFAPT